MSFSFEAPSQKYRIDIYLKENQSDLNYLKKESLSRGKKTAFVVSMLMALQKLEKSPLLILDEVDHGLDDSNMEVFVEILQELTGSAQVLMTSFNPNILKLRNCVYLEVKMNNESKISRIKESRAEELIKSIVKSE